MSKPNLFSYLPSELEPTDEVLLERFVAYVEDCGLSLYPAQEEAIFELYAGLNVILNTPTGSGKSLVASALHFHSLANGRRSVYTCPIKALVNEKWMALCREFGADQVGLSTGDATVNRDAPILCCTAEVLANIALREGDWAPVDDVVMDEFHWYADRDRGVAWQVPLLTLPYTRFLLMSATLGDTRFFEERLTELNRRQSVTIQSADRPVPLEYTYSEIPVAPALEKLVEEQKTPVYVVHFTQADAAKSAQDFTSINVCTKEEKQAIAESISDVRFNSPFGPSIRNWLRHGIGIHHAGLLPKYRVLVEQLAQKGLLKIICGTDTLGVGINVPIRTVLFTRLCKFDGRKTRILSARDFHQISGRAGRKGFDDKGWVVVQAPEHVIENMRTRAKAQQRGGKKAVMRKPPERNFANWDSKTFDRLVAAQPEQLKSRFQVSHGMLLNLLSRVDDGCRAMRRLIADCHDPEHQKRAHKLRAFQLFRSLVESGVIEIIPPAKRVLEVPEGWAEGAEPIRPAKVRVDVELQDDFSMDQTLSLYLLETIPLLDPETPTYPYVLLTLVESILEDPIQILRRQLDKVKGDAIAEMKADGLDYDQRMEELALLEHPQPDLPFIEETFRAFSAKHPWVGQEDIRPKSIAREMFEEFRSFSEYVRDYELQRVEGLLLRHLHNVYKVLAQTVPDGAKTEEVWEMETYLREMIRQVDSSLMDEWEKMRDPTRQLSPEADELRPPGAVDAAADITRDEKGFTATIRTLVFTFLRAIAMGDEEAALGAISSTAVAGSLEEKEEWTVDRLRTVFDDYFEEHERLMLDPEARNKRHTYVMPDKELGIWRVQQMLIDPEGKNDWVAEFHVDLARSRSEGQPWITLARVGGLVPWGAGNDAE
ncbi:MAG: DUF3516 domain-containing protein [Verrucomicrobiota bacterium]|nr:DUF3516 domain-containing protein [Verrucomicrobiota bacterium]